MIRLAINGYGRIGRCVLRALWERGGRGLRIVAINEPADLATIVHLTKYDSTHGRFPGTVSGSAGQLRIDDQAIAVSHHAHPEQLDWVGVDLVLDCSGRYDRLDQLQAHLDAGAARVLLSQPGEDAIPAVVWGVNGELLAGAGPIVSAASCTTNCIAPVIRVLDRAFGIESGVITTVHSAMNDQPVLDAYHHTDLRKTRAAGQSIIPVDTGLASGVGRILPGLAGRFAARALRVPTQNVSAMELTAQLRSPTTGDAVNAALAQEAAGELAGILGYTDEPLASCDFNHDPRSGIVDAGQTRAVGNQVSVVTWFDNEWGYANRMVDVAVAWSQMRAGGMSDV
ncbi:MAG: glyceraldehyde 3-phosphate dehydrogenase NAD-binding domain-containing protein [Spongiibacteraceae bacterium]|jgi:glyceraldehyde-3-phosphate dehydrogenase type I|nr:glyceraldehyde 3-phosphate dehydrogenase NAD-binding domain-containing protein [Spongiibacteraceae bacterium]